VFELLPGDYAKRRRRAAVVAEVGRALWAIATVLAASQNRLLMRQALGEMP